jgi:hypothetical protein
MATNTLIQKLDATAFVSNTTGSPGSYTAVATPDVSNRRQVETFIAGATVVVGDWLMFDTSATGAARVLTVIQATNVALGNSLVVGVCLGSAETDGSLTAGSKINVVISGYVEGANVDGAVVAGSPLVVDTTAGRGQVGVTGDIAFCGVALEADVANKAAVWVYKRF